MQTDSQILRKIREIQLEMAVNALRHPIRSFLVSKITYALSLLPGMSQHRRTRLLHSSTKRNSLLIAKTLEPTPSKSGAEAQYGRFKQIEATNEIYMDRGGLPRPTAPTEEEWMRLEIVGGLTAKCPQVDVIVPVYKGYNETLRCLYSIISEQQNTPFRIIVIDDCSPEPHLSAAIKKLAQLGAIQLLTNETNLGFVKSCNRGLKLHPDRNAILLNSDTEVYGDWIDRLVELSERNSAIGSITPLSNNATICSYPYFLKDNTFQLEATHRELDSIAAKNLHGNYVELPTGVGFCLFISRSCLNTVGLLDDETFGYGYGEEVDLCLRAVKAGFLNVLAPNIFVTHWGATSFGAAQKPSHHRAMSLIDRLHPEYFELIRDFISEDPISEYRANLDLDRIHHRISQESRQCALIIAPFNKDKIVALASSATAHGLIAIFCCPYSTEENFFEILSYDVGPIPNLSPVYAATGSRSLTKFIKSIGILDVYIDDSILNEKARKSLLNDLTQDANLSIHYGLRDIFHAPF